MSKARTESVADLMERAEASLRRRAWFEAERLAAKALSMARSEDEFEAMARILLPLQEARRQRLAEAFEVKKVKVVAEAPNEQTRVTPGVHLVEPPLVGADARRFRLLALEQEVPVAVVCREPITRLNECPVVAIGPVTIRARIDPPKKPSAPTSAWMARALEQLGDHAIANLDSGLDLIKRIDHLLNCLESHPDHEKLHQELAELCREAAAKGLRTPPPSVPAGYEGDD